MTTMNESAGANVFLTNEKASGINGQDIVVDGGTTADLWLIETLPPH